MNMIVRERHHNIYAMLLFAGISILSTQASAALKTWDGSDGNWSDPAAWGGQEPQENDTVEITSGTVTLTNATPALAALTISGSGKLVFSGADTMLTADNITITGAGVRVEHTVNTATEAVGGVWPINGLIHFVCTNFLLGEDAVLEANGRGWTGGTDNTSAPAYGPGAGARRSGGGYGGIGGLFNTLSGSSVYGTADNPSQPGSGGGGAYSTTGGSGGGLVRIESQNGRVEINGIIRANGLKPGHYGSGSGGGIYIHCSVFAGSGMITANGGDSADDGAGAGGRIAVIYDPEEPVHPGSGGGSGQNAGAFGGSGGGLIHLSVYDTLVLNGSLLASGGNAGYYAGGGSGGAIYIHCHRIMGSGEMHADGGDGHVSGGSGGGGRIALWRQQDSFEGTLSVAKGEIDMVDKPSEPGEIFLGDLPARGVLVIFR